MKKLFSTLVIALLILSIVFVPILASAEGATIWTDKDNYGPSETVTIFGSGFLPSTEVTITLVAPDLSVATIYAWTDEFGAFTAQYLLDGMFGTYTVTATDGTNTATTTFTEALKIETYKDSAYTTEETVFLPGATVYAKATGLDNKKSYKIQWFFDAVLKTESSVTTGVTSLTHSYSLAADADIGTWYAKVYCIEEAKVKDTATFYVWHQIAPTADSWVESSHTTDNHGSDNELHVRVDWDSKKGEVTNLRRAYLKFDLSGLPSGAVIDSALLHLYRTTADSDIPSAYQTTDGWTETGIKWSNQPGPGAFVADGTMGSAWFKWDITSYAASEFAGDQILSVVLKFKTESGSDQHADFTSREGTWNQRPWLEVSYHVPPPTVDITITSSPAGSGFVKVEDAAITTPQTFTWTIGSTHKLEALSPVAGSLDTQYVWTSWSDSGAQTHDYTVPSTGETVTANYKTQYYLTVSSDHGTPSGEGWYDYCTNAYAGLDTGEVISDGTKYLFVKWTVDATGTDYAKSDAIHMDGPKTAVAEWKTQHYLTVVSPYGTTGGEGWYDECTYAQATVTPLIVSGPPGVQYVFTGWSGDASGSTSPSDPIHMNGPKTAVANWKVQYYLDVVPTEIPGADWYDECTWVKLTAPMYLPDEFGIGGVRYKFSYWDVDGTAQVGNPIDVHMNAPHVATAYYTVQYYLTVKIDPELTPPLVTILGEGWYDPCTWVTLTAPLEPDVKYLFAYWDVDSFFDVFLENVIKVHMDAPHTATAHYKDYLGHAREEIEDLRAYLNALRAAGKIGKREYDYFRHALNAIEKDITRGMKQLDRERHGFNDRQKGFEDLRHAVMKIKRVIHQVENWVRKGKIPAADAAWIISELETIRMKLVNKCWAEALAEKVLALKAIAAAKALGKDTTKAEAEIIKIDRELAKAIEAIAKGKYSQAIQHFKHAFNHSQHAVKKAYDRSWDTDYKDWIDELEEEDP
jgi:uncharacterized repeat protein (TIGR02543 family)